MNEDCMLTTTDNPYNPFDDFERWFAFDIEKGYNTCAYLARITNIAIDLPDNINEEDIEAGIDEICRLNVLGIYKKVTRSDYK